VGNACIPESADKTTPERTGLAQNSASMMNVSKAQPNGDSLAAEHINTATLPGVRDTITLQSVLFVCIEIPVLFVMLKVLDDNMLVPFPFSTTRHFSAQKHTSLMHSARKSFALDYSPCRREGWCSTRNTSGGAGAEAQSCRQCRCLSGSST
jgi:hypothetical protein